jgi:hypothetical protein
VGVVRLRPKGDQGRADDELPRVFDPADPWPGIRIDVSEVPPLPGHGLRDDSCIALNEMLLMRVVRLDDPSWKTIRSKDKLFVSPGDDRRAEIPLAELGR